MIRATRFISFTTCLAALALVATVSVADAFTLRAPQIVYNSASVQAYLNGVGESIDADNDQVDGQVWSTSISGNSTFTFMLEDAGDAAFNSIGVYNVDDAVPALFQVFPGAATVGWYAVAHFGDASDLVVSLFDNNSVFQGQSFYLGVNKNRFGLYLTSTVGTFYSEDARNGGDPQMLTYAGTGVNFGTWWQCFEDRAFASSDKDFNDAIMLVESVAATEANLMTWGRLKRLYK